MWQMIFGGQEMSERLRKGFYAYAWDLMEDPERIIRQMSEDLGCNAIMLNAHYHHARLLRPRQNGPKTFQTAYHKNI